MFPLTPDLLANSLLNRNRLVFARFPPLPDQVGGDSPWLAARTTPPIPITQQMVQEIKGLYPTELEPAVAGQTPVPHIFLSQVAELITITLKRMPRLREPRPLGVRNIVMTLEKKLETTTSLCCCSALSSSIPQIWPRQTPCHNPQGATAHSSWCPFSADLLSSLSWVPKKRIGGQMRWSSSLWCKPT